MNEREFILETRTKLPTASPVDIHREQAQTHGSSASMSAGVKPSLRTDLEPFLVNRKELYRLFASPIPQSQQSRLFRQIESYQADVENAKRPSAKLLPNLVPRTPVVETFIERVHEKFPGFQADMLVCISPTK